MEMPSRNRLLLVLGAGLLAFAAGAALASGVLPEWRTGEVPDEELFRTRFREVAEGAGFRLSPGEPEPALVTHDRTIAAAYHVLGEQGAEWLTASRAGIRVTVAHPVRRSGVGGEQRLSMDFALDGLLSDVEWIDLESPLFSSSNIASLDALVEALVPLLVAPGESLSPAGGEDVLGGRRSWVHGLAGSSPPQELVVTFAPPTTVEVERRLAGSETLFGQTVLRWSLRAGPVFLAVGGLFLALFLRARIDLINGALLALIALLSLSPSWLTELPPWFFALLILLFGGPGRALWILLMWSAGESLLRSARTDFTTSLDSLRLGRLGPRGGRALLAGFALGSGLAGLRLALYAMAATLPGLSPRGASLLVPIFQGDGSPVMDGTSLAAGVALATAVAVRFLPHRWAGPAAALLAGYAFSPLSLDPLPAEFVANVVICGVLVWTCRRFGLTSLLAAAMVFLLLPAALFSSLHLDWLPVTFTATVALTGVILVLGLVGVSRPDEVETGSLEPPAFLRRLEEDRRFRHEVDLLSRMQLGLLPQEMPRVEGYDLAARSVLASEAGGDLYDALRDEAGNLWLAAGDVAGHGYSCAISQAMVKAGLVSLIAPGESPAGVLRQLDRVLRGVATDHSFTSLALLRLDPASGEAVLGNAGHPYPLLFAEGRVTEIELPGLPLGQGPARTYDDRAFHLPPRSALALCSDGLFEVLDRNGNAYGFERAREVLQAIGHRPAVEIVDTLLNDCRRHVGGGELPDDVTVVVVRRG